MFYVFVIVVNLLIGLLVYTASRRDSEKMQAEYDKRHADRLERLRKDYL